MLARRGYDQTLASDVVGVELDLELERRSI